MTTDPSPPARGKNLVQVTLDDSRGAPISGGKVQVVFFMPAMPSMGMAAIRAESALADQGSGKYSAEITLASGGTFTVTISAEKAGRPIANKQMSITVSGPMAM